LCVKTYRVVYDTIIKASEGKLTYGKNIRVGVPEGVIGFTFDDENYKKYVPEWIQEIVKAYYILLKYSLINALGE